MKATMGMYDIRRGDRLIYVSGPYDDRAPHLFRNAGGWWESATGEWNFYVEDERALANALLDIYGEVPYWLGQSRTQNHADPSSAIAMGVVGGAALLIFLLAAMN